jgi:hypothetical protein
MPAKRCDYQRVICKESDANEYVHMVDGIKGESDFGLFQSCHYKPFESTTIGVGCYRHMPSRIN